MKIPQNREMIKQYKYIYQTKVDQISKILTLTHTFLPSNVIDNYWKKFNLELNLFVKGVKINFTCDEIIFQFNKFECSFF